MVASIVGLDMGSTALRGVQISYGRTGAIGSVLRGASVELPPDVMRNGVVTDAAAMKSALKTLWRRGRFTTRKVAFALADSGVLTRQVDLPWMEPTDFATALRYQIGDALPVDVSSVELDYHLLDELSQTDEIGNPTVINRILVVAANRDAVKAQAAILRSARLETVAADSSAFALIRTACAGRLPTDSAPRALVDIGGDQLTFVIHQDGQPRFIRTIANLGGNAATAAIADRFDLDWADAEQRKRDTGLNGPAPMVAPIAESSVFGSVHTLTAANPAVQATVEVLNPWATKIISEIRNSIDYFQASQPGQALSSLDLTGLTMRIDGLEQRIATEIPLAIRTVHPFGGLPRASRVKIDDVEAAGFTVATGMALRGMP